MRDQRRGPAADEAENLAFGPNSDRVLALLRRVATLDPLGTKRLVSFWAAVAPDRRAAAHAAAQEAARSSGRRDAARAAQSEAMRWIDDDVVTTEMWGGGGTSGRTRDWVQVRRDALPAVLDAIAAVVLADVLEADAREVLVGPWSAAIGEPAD